MHHSAPFFAAAGDGPQFNDHPEPMQAEGRGLNPHYRITQGDIEEAIDSAHYFTGLDGVTGEQHREIGFYDHRNVPEERLHSITICVLVLKSGVSVVGVEHCQDGVELDEAIGRQGALENAMRQVWPLVIHERKARIARGE